MIRRSTLRNSSMKTHTKVTTPAITIACLTDSQRSVKKRHTQLKPWATLTVGQTV